MEYESRKYRIEQRGNTYRIQVRGYNKPFFTKRWKWLDTNYAGGCMKTFDKPSSDFTSLKDASNQVKEWTDKFNSEPIYHEC